MMKVQISLLRPRRLKALDNNVDNIHYFQQLYKSLPEGCDFPIPSLFCIEINNILPGSQIIMVINSIRSTKMEIFSIKSFRHQLLQRKVM